MSEKLRRGKARLRAAWDRLWDKVTARIPRLSRPWRAARNLACIILAACLTWFFLGQPTIGDTWMFRRAEQQAMVGPSEILGTVQVNERDYRRMMVGETEHGIALHPLNESNHFASVCRLYYLEKTGDITLICAPNNGAIGAGSEGYQLTLLLFTEYPAARAEVDLLISEARYGDYVRQWQYSLSAEMEEEGFFIMELAQSDPENIREAYALERLKDYFYLEAWDTEHPMYADIRLYDAAGALMEEAHLDMSELWPEA